MLTKTMTMSRIAGNALRIICEKIQQCRLAGWTSRNRPVKVLTERHDRILRRWPNAYDN